MAGNTDTLFAFLDKHLTHIALGIGALIVYKTIKKSIPTDEEKAEQADTTAQQDVNARLSPPPAPEVDPSTGKLDPHDEKDYFVKLKAHRSAVYATKLYHSMHTIAGVFDFGDFDGTDSAAILDVAYSIALARISLPQLQADYLALQTKSALMGKRIALLDDLKAELSTADYLTFMRRIGMTPDQAQAALHPKKTSK